MDGKVLPSGEADAAGVELALEQEDVGVGEMALPPLSVKSPAAQRFDRQGMQQFMQYPKTALRRLGPQAARMSATVAQQAAQLHKKTLKRSVVHTSAESNLKLGTLNSKDIATLVLAVHLVVLLGPIGQVIWTVFIEPDTPETPPARREFDMSLGDAAEAAIQLFVLGFAALFVIRILSYSKRQPTQVAFVSLVAFAGFIAALTLAADVLKSFRSYSDRGRNLLSIANALFAVFIYLTLGYLSDHFAETALASLDGFKNPKQEKLLMKSRNFALAFNVSCVAYLILRLVITWRSEVVFDFIPMTNFITPLRVRGVERKEIVERHVFLDSLLISAADAALMFLAFAKCHFTHRLFRHIFVADFARIYTEYRVFTIDFRNMVALVTLSGHVASWAVPFYHTIEPARLKQPQLPLESIGSVQMQLGFRFSLALWLIAAMYCALPADTRGFRGWFCGVRTEKAPEPRVQYYLYESDVHLTAGYRNLALTGHVDQYRFVMESQVEAFNFAQLVYARGNKTYDQGLEHLKKLIGDPSFSLVEVIHDAPTDTHCLILESETKIVITFRGTMSKKNAQTDLKSSMTLHLCAKQLDLTKIPSLRPRPQAVVEAQQVIRTFWHKILCKRNDPKVHSGFYTAYMSVSERVLEKVGELHRADSRQVLVTGHSLGGALAVLCSFDVVARLRISNVMCTTFGCPRLGNHAFKKRHAHVVPATFAFINASDMITKLPPRTPKAQSYASVGKIILINSFGNLVIEPNILQLDVLHRGYSPKAHTMRAYHLSMLLWSLRTHQNKYHPKFWRQSLAFLKASYGHLPEVHDYLKASMLVYGHLHASMRTLKLEASGGLVEPTSDQRAQLRLVVRRLEAGLRQEEEDREDDVISLSLLSQLWRWLRSTESVEWFATNDAIRLLISQLRLENEAAAVELGQLLTVHGFIKPERVVFGSDSRFHFLALDDKDQEDAEEEEEGAGEGGKGEEGEGVASTHHPREDQHSRENL